MSEDWKAIKRELRVHGWMLFVPLAVMWIVQIVNALTLHALDRFGVHPWSVPGLIGILFMPFLHVGFGHLIANTTGFLLFGWMILLHDVRDYVVTSLLAMLVSGVGVWLTGMPGSVHVGASGVIFGYLGFLMLRGIFRRSIVSILLSIVMVVLFGYSLTGLIPQAGLSWQGHLFGFLGGGLSAWLLARKPRQDIPVRVAVR